MQYRCVRASECMNLVWSDLVSRWVAPRRDQLFGLDLESLPTRTNTRDNVTRVHFHRASVTVAGPIVFSIIGHNPGPQKRQQLARPRGRPRE